MREILFRGKRIDNGELVEGGIVHQTDYYGDSVDRYFIIDGTDTDDIIGPAYRVHPDTVGQYTGLTDKNGKKIFEGDIVQEDDVIHNGEIQIKGKVGSISFEKSCFVVLYNDTWDFLQTNAKVVLVIGNIHDNPELLGGDDK